MRGNLAGKFGLATVVLVSSLFLLPGSFAQGRSAVSNAPSAVSVSVSSLSHVSALRPAFLLAESLTGNGKKKGGGGNGGNGGGGGHAVPEGGSALLYLGIAVLACGSAALIARRHKRTMATVKR